VNLSLFEDPEAAPEPATRQFLRERLGQLRAEGVWIGTSSWKYEGWLGQIYTPERYQTRGKLSQKRFEETCLAEYAEVFPIVCGDFSFYQFPTPDFWRKLFTTAPPGLRFAFKVPEEITVRVWPQHARYGAKAGFDNEAFLNAAYFRAGFTDLLIPYSDRIAALIFEFSPMPRFTLADPSDFLDPLDAFLTTLPADFRYGVEIRNPELFTPAYLQLLAAHRTAHVFNAWTRMPELAVQLDTPGAFTTDFSIVRALLKQGRPYEQAVQMFSPYRSIQDPYPAGRAALRKAISQARIRKQPSFLFVNNRFEGNAPGTIEAVLEAN
jgi:uncharacterized protein YecE (DUF72 family)